MVYQDNYEKILDQVKTFLTAKNIDECSTKKLCQACNISTRTFYNYFYDKYNAAQAVYIHYMKQFINSTLDVWFEERADFFIYEASYIRHCMISSKSNQYIEIMKKIDLEKIRMHVTEDANKDPILKSSVETGILLFVNGLSSMFLDEQNKKFLMDEKVFNSGYNSNWDVIQGWFPNIVWKYLSDTPLQSPSEELLQILENKKIL